MASGRIRDEDVTYVRDNSAIDDVVGDFGGNWVFVGVASRLVYADESGHFDFRDDWVAVFDCSDVGGNGECDKME